MENLFVPYEQSLALKELGFNKPCFGRYYSKESYPMLNPQSEETELVFEFGQYIKQTDVTILSPTFSQAFKFIREKYNLIGLVEGGYDNGKNIFTYVIWDGFKDNMFDEYFETYEEAELTCLNELIKLVKTK